MRSCQAKRLCWLDLRDGGSPKTMVSNYLSTRNVLITRGDFAQISPYSPSREDQPVN
jgi:hypothetical protein